MQIHDPNFVQHTAAVQLVLSFLSVLFNTQGFSNSYPGLLFFPDCMSRQAEKVKSIRGGFIDVLFNSSLQSL